MAQSRGPLMTSTRRRPRASLGSAWPGHFSVPIGEDMYENMAKVGLPQWSEQDQAVAESHSSTT